MKMKNKKLKKKLSFLLAIIMMVGVFMPLEKEVNAAGVTITYSGGIRLPGASTKVGKFMINGKRAFCLQHTELHPPGGTKMNGSPYTNKRIAKALYYGWAGVKPWGGFKAGSQSGVSWSRAEHGIVLTSLLLSCYYNGDSPGSYSYIRGFSAFKNYVESRPNVVNDRVAFSKNNLTAKWNSSLNLQKTDSVKIKGDSGSSISFTLPKGVTMVNASTGAKSTGRVTAKVGKTYYFTAKGNVTGTYKTGAVGKNWKFQPLVFKKSGGGVQDLTKGDKVIDPALKTSLEIKWSNLGSGKVIKVSESGKRVAGAKFKITGNGITKTGTTGSKGEYIFTGLVPGKYKISEVSVPSPYLLDKTPKNLTVAINKVASVTFTNKYARGKFTLAKTKENGKALKDATFKIWSAGNDPEGKPIKFSVTKKTDDNGKIALTGLKLGKYNYQETNAPSPYVLDKSVKSFTLTYKNQSTTVVSASRTVKNALPKGEFTLVKKDTKGITLKGAKFRIWSDGNDLEGKSINFDKEFTTDENGKIKVTGLKLGKYNYQEVKAPIGFACDKNTYSFTLSYKDQNTSVIKESASRNNKQVIFFKTDEKGVILSGGNFEILDKDGKSIGKIDGKFKDEGKFLAGSEGLPLPNLTEGEEYTLRETDPPFGYGLASDIKFTVSKTKEDQMVLMVDGKSSIKTTALDSDTNDHISKPDSDVTINDTVKYQNLIPGKEYEMEGKLMDKGANKPMTDDNGKEITAKSKFKASDSGKGSVVITFKFSGKTLEGKTTVAFETLKKEGKEVATHTDINDIKQSVDFPRLITTANVSKDLKKVSDKVEYTNLIPGKKYKLKGWLVNKETREVLKASETEKEFNAKSNNGKVIMTLNSEHGKKNKKYVVFEECYMDGKLIGKHKDINDKHQTVDLKVGKVVIKAPKDNGSIIRTGDYFPLKLLILFFVISGIGTALMLLRRKNTGA